MTEESSSFFCTDSSLQVAQFSKKPDFDPKNAVLKAYMAQILAVSLQCQQVGVARPH
jgi:hypothetical protein